MIRIGRESQCLLYAGFFLYTLYIYIFSKENFQKNYILLVFFLHFRNMVFDQTSPLYTVSELRGVPLSITDDTRRTARKSCVLYRIIPQPSLYETFVHH